MPLFRIGGKRSLALAATLTAVAAAALAPAAGAATLAADTTCSMPGVTSQPFTAWGDTASYYLAPGGGAEGQLQKWTLTGGAGTAAGNESYFVHSAADKRSLIIPAGGSATTPAACIAVNAPNFRFFLKNSTSAQGSLKVQINGVGTLGDVRSLWSSTLSPTSAWTLSASQYFLVNLNALYSSTGTTPMSITFSATGGAVQIDDIYIDPYRRG